MVLKLSAQKQHHEKKKKDNLNEHFQQRKQTNAK